MSFLSILKAIGLDIVKGINIASKYANILPAVAVLEPQLAAPLGLINAAIQSIIQVEGSAAALAQNGLSISGEQKLIMASTQVGQVLLQAFPHLDPTKITAMSKGITQAVVDVLNGFAAPPVPA